jgi:hypothetical protein
MADLALLYGNLSPSKYVDLDLSGCFGSAVPIAQGTDAYKPQKTKIVGITYPESIETIEDADWSLGTGGGLAIPYKNFTALKRVSLPGALYIGNKAFYKIGTLETLDAPKVKTIAPYAFGDATPSSGNQIVNLSLPEVRFVYEYAFLASNRLKTLSLPKVEYIGTNAFQVGAANIDISETLTEIDLPNVLEIASGAFANRPIEEVNFPKLVKYAGFSITAPFIANSANPLSVLPPSVKSIGADAFTGMASFSGAVTIPANIIEIGDNAFKNCDYITEIHGAGVIIIGADAFARADSTSATGVLTTVDFPNAVTVKDRAFQYQRMIANVNLPKAEAIGGNTFGMSSTRPNAALASVSLPSAVSLGASTQEAFVNCVNLETIELGASVPMLLATTKFTSISTSYHIDVPAAALPAYQAACASGAKGWTSTLAGKLQTY